jgi:hypothetical protein
MERVTEEERKVTLPLPRNAARISYSPTMPRERLRERRCRFSSPKGLSLMKLSN